MKLFPAAGSAKVIFNIAVTVCIRSGLRGEAHVADRIGRERYQILHFVGKLVLQFAVLVAFDEYFANSIACFDEVFMRDLVINLLAVPARFYDVSLAQHHEMLA